MDISKNEMLNILHNLNDMFDKNNCEHLQLLLYLTYLNDREDKEINQLIEQLILKTKISNDCINQEKICCSNKIIDFSHPYSQSDNLNAYFVSHKFRDFLDF